MDVEAIKQREDNLGSAYVPDTEEEKRLVRKIDLYLLPCIWVMYLMSYLDRTNVGLTVSNHSSHDVLWCWVLFPLTTRPDWQRQNRWHGDRP